MIVTIMYILLVPSSFQYKQVYFTSKTVLLRNNEPLQFEDVLIKRRTIIKCKTKGIYRSRPINFCIN